MVGDEVAAILYGALFLTTEGSGDIILGYDDICSLRGEEVEPWKGGKGGGEAIKI